jgi:hypothetical protein
VNREVILEEVFTGVDGATEQEGECAPNDSDG